MEGSIVNRFALATALAIGLSSIAQAKVVELVPEPAAGVPAAGVPAAGAAPLHVRAGDAASQPAFALPPGISELPEPEVFAMMLVGLVLLGYRAPRDSSEKFK